MGAYTNWGLVAGRYPTVATSRTEADAEDNFIAGAEGEINSRLATKYTTPFSTVPALITDLATDLTYVKLRHYTKDVKGVADHIESIFKGLLDGTITLTEGESSGGNEAYINETYHSAFGLDDPVEWSRDQDQLAEESDARL